MALLRHRGEATPRKGYSKHLQNVRWARSHFLKFFIDAITSLKSNLTGRGIFRRSQERTLERLRKRTNLSLDVQGGKHQRVEVKILGNSWTSPRIRRGESNLPASPTLGHECTPWSSARFADLGRRPTFLHSPWSVLTWKKKESWGERKQFEFDVEVDGSSLNVEKHLRYI